MNTASCVKTASITSYQWMVFGVCWLAGAFSGMNASLFSVVLPQAIAELSFGVTAADISYYGSTVMSSFLIGWMIGGIFLGFCSDRFGRVKTMAASIFLYAVFTATAGISQNIVHLAICRFFIGVGVGGTMVSIAIFLAETWPTKSRAIALSALITSYQAGVFLSGFAAQMFSEWRIVFAVGLLPVILVFPILQYFNESSKKPMSASQNRKSIIDKNLVLGSIIFGSLLVGYWASSSWIPTWIQDMVQNGKAGNEKNISTMIHGFCAILGCLVAGPLADCCGRRPIICASFAGASLVSLTMFLGHTSFSWIIYASHGALGFCIGVAQAVMYVYLSEIFSAEVRATCVGICLNVGRLLTAVAVLFLGSIVAWFGGYAVALSFFSLIYMIGAILVWKCPKEAVETTSYN